MEIYRQCNVFERILTLYSADNRDKIVHLLYRCTYVEGSLTLVTRCGILSWIQGQIKVSGSQGLLLKQLALRVLETSDEQRVGEWSDGGNVALVENIRKMRFT